MIINPFPDSMMVNETSCELCPRICRADRTRGSGFCRARLELAVPSLCLHRGEEPVVSGSHGICNIFFGGCNLRCVYCQNHQISMSALDAVPVSMDSLLDGIGSMLDKGARSVGFVSPSHQVPMVMDIMDGLERRNRNPVYVYNTASYDRADVLAGLEGRVHVYLPDFKYMDAGLARELSGAEDYPVVAVKALREMLRQRGTTLRIAEDGTAESGIIIRHLVLPGYVENSKMVLRAIAWELSTAVHVSLMSQYHPVPAVMNHPSLGRTLHHEEYLEVLAEFESLGFFRGWVQEFDSHGHYLPDFDREHPFE